jgi:predicted transcriptional regulator
VDASTGLEELAKAAAIPRATLARHLGGQRDLRASDLFAILGAVAGQEGLRLVVAVEPSAATTLAP